MRPRMMHSVQAEPTQLGIIVAAYICPIYCSGKYARLGLTGGVESRTHQSSQQYQDKRTAKNRACPTMTIEVKMAEALLRQCHLQSSQHSNNTLRDPDGTAILIHSSTSARRRRDMGLFIMTTSPVCCDRVASFFLSWTKTAARRLLAANSIADPV